jgi:hypothetical protein
MGHPELMLAADSVNYMHYKLHIIKLLLGVLALEGEVVGDNVVPDDRYLKHDRCG